MKAFPPINQSCIPRLRFRFKQLCTKIGIIPIAALNWREDAEIPIHSINHSKMVPY
ncbi:hypothetical protein P9764_00940 [Bacillus smithii]|uniref:hypothetical protein n=1 Tax=Bacillus smithii TaxID=1479 RepID=UPI00031DA76D|nr:hypothetical protein [Bacillus smithii]AKP47463.1 hypothetical protein BSM4216_2218 [Bacillus smithii]MED4882514.1 hypothetical protein [Bacillus smithii]